MQLDLFLGVGGRFLRFWQGDELVPTLEEVAIIAEQKAERLAAKLRELNIDPDSL